MKDLKDILNKELTKKEVYELILGEKPLTSGNKVSQEKRLKSKCNYHTIGKGRGTKYVVTEIFESDKPIFDGRVNNQGGNNIDTVIDIETIIMWLVNNQFDKVKKDYILLSKNNALIMMGLVHENYKKTRNNIEDIAYDLNIDLNYLSQFFLKNHNQIIKKLERALKRLHSQKYINFKQCFIICHNKYKEHRIATEEESDEILTIEGIVLNEMNLKHKGMVYICGKWKQFKNRCEELLHERGLEDILFYYEGYEIRATKESIKRAVDDLEYNRSLLNVNDKVLNQCDKSTQKLRIEMLNSFDREIERLKKVAFGEPPYYLIDLYENQKVKYITINQHLVKGNISEYVNEIISKYK